MHGLIGSFTAHPGKRDELIAAITGVGPMPGCLSYVTAMDPSDEDRVWITEVWDSAEAHKASLGLPAVARSIAVAMPLIASIGDQIVTEPAGGVGLGAPSALPNP